MTETTSALSIFDGDHRPKDFPEQRRAMKAYLEAIAKGSDNRVIEIEEIYQLFSDTKRPIGTILHNARKALIKVGVLKASRTQKGSSELANRALKGCDQIEAQLWLTDLSRLPFEVRKRVGTTFKTECEDIEKPKEAKIDPKEEAYELANSIATPNRKARFLALIPILQIIEESISKGRGILPSYGKIKKHAGIKESGMQKAVKDLIQYGLLRKEERGELHIITDTVISASDILAAFYESEEAQLSQLQEIPIKVRSWIGESLDDALKEKKSILQRIIDDETAKETPKNDEQ